MKRHLSKLSVAALAFLVGLASAGNLSYEIGRILAWIDVARGNYELQAYGTIDGDLEEFSEIAANDYDIEVVPHGCTISEQGIERLRGYNDVSLAAIKRKYGDEVIDRIWDRAQQQYRAKKLAR
jgi:hypothetical protein